MSTVVPDNPHPPPTHSSSQISMGSSDSDGGEPVFSGAATVDEKGNPTHPSRKQFRHRTKSITGETIYKDHPSHAIMLNIKLGVRHTVGRPAARETRELTLQDFQFEPKTFFPARGSANTPTHKSPDFKFKDYAPLAFKHIRSRFGIDEAEYMLSIGGEGALKEVPTPGKSGALFYKTKDDKFLIKTITKAETKYFRHILAQYYNHVMQHQDTFLPRFFQLFRIKTKQGNNIRMVVMHNILPSHLLITERYDIKGSTYGRRTPDELRLRPNVTLKDLDFTEMGKRLVLGTDKKKILMRQLQVDSSFLATAKLMDYSLLIGVKPVTEDLSRERLILQHQQRSNQPSIASTSSNFPTSSSSSRNNSTANTTSSFSHVYHVSTSSHRTTQMQSSELYAFDGALECTNENGESILVYCGIIDILQEYDVRKQIEHLYKGARFDKHTISAVAPENYALRFVDYLKSRVFF
eukprot:c2955_g1_i1.p1 GENE.c2955_g1_i1~~c2955_g1_i1.p1  ORF type:complete len:465 (-),score=99.80 c2955_g1_i1:244-1638(-)